jgi:hypothetical protein
MLKNGNVWPMHAHRLMACFYIARKRNQGSNQGVESTVHLHLMFFCVLLFHVYPLKPVNVLSFPSRHPGEPDETISCFSSSSTWLTTVG